MSASMSVDLVGNLMSSLGSPHFGAQYFDIFREVLSIDRCNVFAFNGTAPPTTVLVEAQSAQLRSVTRTVANEYATSGFEQVPSIERRPASLDRQTVFCIRADELKNQSYRRQYYDQPNLAHEFVIMGEAANTLYHASFFRSDPNAGFDDSDLRYVFQTARFAVEALHCHYRLLDGNRPPASVSVRDAGHIENRAETLAHLQ